MIRTCMYCGRELEAGEVCHCAQSEQARKRREQSQKKSEGAASAKSTEGAEQSGQTTYRQPYTSQPRPKENWTQKAKRSYQRVSAKFKQRGAGRKAGFLHNFGTFFARFFRSPVYTVSNPANMGVGESLILVAAQAIVSALVILFAYRSVLRGISSLITSLIPGMGGAASVALIGGWNPAILFCVVIGFIFLQFFLLSALFFFITRVMMRQSKVKFWNVAVRFAISSLPITVIGLAGIVFSFFSLPTVLVLLALACVMSVVLGYEGLCAEWQLSPDRVIWITILGYMVYLFFCQGFGRILLQLLMG
jgi:cation transport ATPase